MADGAGPGLEPWLALNRLPHRLAHWGGLLVLVASLGFIAERLWRLDPGQLSSVWSWPLVGAGLAAAGSCALADALLCRGWAILADTEGRLDARQTAAIYGRGVLLKYLPGSVFQYLARQVGGAGAGLAQASLAKASFKEALLHLLASMTVAALVALVALQPVMGLVGAATIGLIAMRSRTPLMRSLSLQIGAFAAFALAAILVGGAILPDGVPLGMFAAMFLAAWLAGFVVPVAPGGIGVREAALLALAGGLVAPSTLLACVLVLRIASILGDLGYGLVALARSSRTALRR